MKNFKQWCEEENAFSLLNLYENADNEIKSTEIGFSSPKIVNWKCKSCNTEWKQDLNKTTKRKLRECPYCNLQRPSYFYNLKTEYPILAEEWDFIKNKKPPNEYLPTSKVKVWWRCKKGHSWENIIADRVKSTKLNIKAGRPICPYCNHKIVSNNYNLVTEYPNIARQWDYIKNGSIIPLEVSPKSHKKVWWICEYNPMHRWQDRVSNRTALNRVCPVCSKKFTISFPARVIYYYLKLDFDDCEMEYKMAGKYILDVYLPYYKIIIEYDGIYFHSDKSAEERELKKDNILRAKGYEVIRIKETKVDTDKITYKNNIISYKLQERYVNLDKLVKKVLDIIEEKTKIKIKKDINIDRDRQKIEDLYYHVRKSKSLAVQHPELAKEWSPNNPILPDSITIGSQYPAKWICPKCNREYTATISNRVKMKSNCSYCANRKVSEVNSLAKCYPEIAKEWNYEKNEDLLPTDVVTGCDKKVWWKCEKGHEWETRIYSRTGKHKSKCPYCSGKYLLYENSLEARRPDLVDIWNYEKNNGKTPKDFSVSSNKRVWWKCAKGHEWERMIHNVQIMKSEEKCPYCSGRESLVN